MIVEDNGISLSRLLSTRSFFCFFDGVLCVCRRLLKHLLI